MPKILTMLFSFALVLGLALASNHDDFDIERGEQAMLRIAHLSPDAFNVDVRFDDETILEDVAFADVSAYKIVPSGTHSVAIYEAGEDSAAIDASIDFESGTYYTLAVLGFAEDLQVFLYIDDFSDNFPSANEALIRVVHASPDADEIDLYKLYDGETESVVTGLAFSQLNAYSAVYAYEYNFELREAGETDVLVDLEDVELRPGYVYTFFIAGSREGEGNGDDPVVEAEVATPVAEAEEEEEDDPDDADLEIIITVDARVDGEPLDDDDFEQERN